MCCCCCYLQTQPCKLFLIVIKIPNNCKILSASNSTYCAGEMIWNVIGNIMQTKQAILAPLKCKIQPSKGKDKKN